MRKQFFDSGFLFDFYIDRGSIGTLSVRSNVSRARAGSLKTDKAPFLRFFQCLITRYRKIRKRRKTIFGGLVVGWALY